MKNLVLLFFLLQYTTDDDDEEAKASDEKAARKAKVQRSQVLSLALYSLFVQETFTEPIELIFESVEGVTPRFLLAQCFVQSVFVSTSIGS